MKEIEEKLKAPEVDEAFIEQISKDERKGVQSLLNKWKKNQEKRKKLEEQFLLMTKYEQKARKQGFKLIAGVDEVGRGPLAGPVVAAAVILPESFILFGLNDSKKLSKNEREQYYDYIKEHAIAIGIGRIDAEEIDRMNIYEATKKAMLTSINELNVTPDYILIDAMKLDTPYPTESIVKGDSLSISIAAASVIAKVTRDRYMEQLGEQYPQYFFEKNVGYGTKEHLEAIKKYGITPYHRKSFAPIKNGFDTMNK